MVGPDATTVLAEAMNSHTIDKGPGHAEANLCRDVAKRLDVATLRHSTLYTVEPCCMCSGTIYWTEIGTVVFGMTERRLADLTGDDPDNATMAMDCRTVLAAGRRDMIVRGPYSELDERIVAQHNNFWKLVYQKRFLMRYNDL